VPNFAQSVGQSSARVAIAQVAIALGSNLSAQLDGQGDRLEPAQILSITLDLLGQHPHIQVLKQSHWYETLPVGPPQPNYLNGCCILQVGLSPLELMQILLAIEARFGRVRQLHWGPRSLDLDILLCDQDIIHTPTLTVPHPQMRQRAFVLVPLAEIAPDWIEPVTQLSIAQLQRLVDCSGVQPILL
jgi:2-amino-4-hydroxy-6-hydroxymethyldihydropteridine diphosphokinase